MSEQNEIDRRALIVGGMGAALTPVVAANSDMFDVQEVDEEIKQVARKLRDLMTKRHGIGYQAHLVTSHNGPLPDQLSVVVSRQA